MPSNQSQQKSGEVGQNPQSANSKNRYRLKTKMVEEAKLCESAQRIQVELERHVSGKHVKIRVENHDSGLGWYTSGSLTVPLHQLPLLEQAIGEMRRLPIEENYAEIIPFPGAMAEPAA
jgi:hypothetical protein